MKQSRLMSLVEAAANVVVGYGVAVVTQLVVFPWFGLPARVTDALGIGAVMTGVPVVRTYALRRLFEAIRSWHNRRGLDAAPSDESATRPGLWKTCRDASGWSERL